MGNSSPCSRRVPPELFHGIILEIIHPTPGADRSSHKRALASCSLTCKFWAAKIRPTLFSELVLRSYQDVAHLMDIIDPSIGAALRLVDARWVKELLIIHSSAEIPWLHRVHGLSMRLYNPKIQLCMTLDKGHASLKPLEEVQLPLPLPRRLPGSVFPFYRIVLDGIYVRCTSDLARIVHMLPTLRQCECKKLKFKENSMAFWTCAGVRRVGGCTEFSMVDCEDGKAGSQIKLALWISSISKRFGRRNIEHRLFDAIAPLVHQSSCCNAKLQIDGGCMGLQNHREHD